MYQGADQTRNEGYASAVNVPVQPDGVAPVVRVGSICSGYGGLELGIELALGSTQVEWVADNDPAATRILAERFPSSPNLGDVTTIDWARVAPIDVLCGGTPCQDLSQAGRGVGITNTSRSGLWAAMARAVQALHPTIVVWENVEGALYRGAECNGTDRVVGHGQANMEGSPRRPLLRAAGRVVGDLATLGYDSQWTVIPASAVGAPHRRNRLFIIATPTKSDNFPQLARRIAAHRAAQAPLETGSQKLSQELWRPMRTLPTITTQDIPYTSPGCGPTLTTALCGARTSPTNPFGVYEPAIRRWEYFTRPAPHPTEESTRSKRKRINIDFVEWMMGLPHGWVTDPQLHLSRAQQLRLLGNGVCPQQAGEAIHYLVTQHQQLIERICQ